jgi:hypothetical protein
VDSIIHKKIMAWNLERESDVKPLGIVYIPYVTIFKTRHAVRSYLRKTKPIKKEKEKSQCVSKISCECGKCKL